MATAVSGRWPERLRAGSLGQANYEALIGQSPLPVLDPVMRFANPAFRDPHSPFRIHSLDSCEDSPSAGHVGMRESPITSHFSPITLVAASPRRQFRQKLRQSGQKAGLISEIVVSLAGTQGENGTATVSTTLEGQEQTRAVKSAATTSSPKNPLLTRAKPIRQSINLFRICFISILGKQSKPNFLRLPPTQSEQKPCSLLQNNRAMCEDHSRLRAHSRSLRP
jgi:hypothetical protein